MAGQDQGKGSVRFDELRAARDKQVREYGELLADANAIHKRLSELRADIRSLETVMKSLGEDIGTACLPNPGSHGSISGLARHILEGGDGPMTTEDLAARMAAMGKSTTPGSVDVTLGRSAGFVRTGPRTWGLK